jgi:alpha-glucosidase (family GH31 glycosyl hydrolase)
VEDGVVMPFGSSLVQQDLWSLKGNQGMPLLISNRGRYVWSEQPIVFDFSPTMLTIQTSHGLRGEIICGGEHGDLRSALREASRRFFPPQNLLPDPFLLTSPQYNTWIEMVYNPTQSKVLQYAHSLLEHGFPPGVLMIDDNWMNDYGDWRFHPGRFPTPKLLVEQLHGLGFKVMLWTCPFVSPDSVVYRNLLTKGFLIRSGSGEIAVRPWWNGWSAILDFTNPEAVAWYRSSLDILMEQVGVDGFKFDAGDPEFYQPDDISASSITPVEHCRRYSMIGTHYRLNEFRASWKTAGLPLVQRLRDKDHRWDGTGLSCLIPNSLAQGLMGYAFICPDMIGGGEILSFNTLSFRLDSELFVRFAQCSALFPMMQFSAAPWRMLDRTHRELCRESALLHVRMATEIEQLARHAAHTGEPILRHLAYCFPDGGYEMIKDQFMLGDDILVAPVLHKNAISREVVFPPGEWMSEDGKLVDGPSSRRVDVKLSTLPWYRRQ